MLKLHHIPNSFSSSCNRSDWSDRNSLTTELFSSTTRNLSRVLDYRSFPLNSTWQSYNHQIESHMSKNVTIERGIYVYTGNTFQKIDEREIFNKSRPTYRLSKNSMKEITWLRHLKFAFNRSRWQQKSKLFKKLSIIVRFTKKEVVVIEIVSSTL